MSETEPMSIDEQQKYLHKMRIRYWQAPTKPRRYFLIPIAIVALVTTTAYLYFTY